MLERRAGVEQASREETAAQGADGAEGYGDWNGTLAGMRRWSMVLKRPTPV
jgi:hypothetical protein